MKQKIKKINVKKILITKLLERLKEIKVTTKKGRVYPINKIWEDDGEVYVRQYILFKNSDVPIINIKDIVKIEKQAK